MTRESSYISRWNSPPAQVPQKTLASLFMLIPPWNGRALKARPSPRGINPVAVDGAPNIRSAGWLVAIEAFRCVHVFRHTPPLLNSALRLKNEHTHPIISIAEKIS